MGIFDFFGGGKGGGKEGLRKQAQKITTKFGPPENRQKVIEQLAAIDSAEALGTLCLRFTIRADPGITDDEEKERVREILVEAGEKAVGPVKEFLEAQESGVSWGLRVLAALRPPPDVVGTALRLLHRLGREYTRDPEKKIVLLGWLAEHHGDLSASAAAGAAPGVAADAPPLDEALLPLLEDFSDDVRIAAVRVLAQQPLTERTRAALIELYLRDKDNARVRGEVLDALAALGADVKGYRPSVEALLAEPWFLDKEGRVKKRG
ncbi:MAG TPA: HEAT repeat domain-containing protein [Anaeromyxobacteraceae bacterium]|nr:HEAT repeat domain-containing protein [Anaeromyxobacteraceae bacterium]